MKNKKSCTEQNYISLSLDCHKLNGREGRKKRCKLDLLLLHVCNVASSGRLSEEKYQILIAKKVKLMGLGSFSSGR